MNYKRLMIASMLALTGTILLLIQNLPTSSDFPKEEGSLSVMHTAEEELEGQATILETSAAIQKISYQLKYAIETDRLNKNITLLHQLSAPITLEDSSLPKECSYDFELTITCIYQESSYYVEKDINMTLAYDRTIVDEAPISKILAYTSYENKKTDGKEQWIDNFSLPTEQ